MSKNTLACLSGLVLSVTAPIQSYPSTQVEKSNAPIESSSSSKAAQRRFRAETLLQKHSTLLQSPSSEKLAPHYLEELQEKWQFPSDHLPVGATVDDFHVATWNVLNTKFMSWVYANTQGLSHSLIADEDVAVNDSGLTIRDQHVIRLIIEMLEHPTHPKSILSLQECGKPFIAELKKSLPSHIKIVLSSERPIGDQNITLYDSRQFTLVENESRVVKGAYYDGRTLLDSVFIHNQTQRKYRVINTHVPGDPAGPGRYDLAEFAMKTRREDLVTIIQGDMNFSNTQMQQAFDQSCLIREVNNPFTLLAAYYTNIGVNPGPQKEIKSLDHVLVDFGSNVGYASVLNPEEVMTGLSKTSDMLEPQYVQN